jgi:hypothetical protein
MLLNVDAGGGLGVDVEVNGVFAPAEFGSGLLDHPHLQAITRLVCDMVS